MATAYQLETTTDRYQLEDGSGVLLVEIFDTNITPDLIALATASFAPTVVATNNISVTPGTLALVSTAFAPTVATPRLVTPDVLALVLSTFAPTVATPRLVTPDATALTVATFAPAVLTPQLVIPDIVALTLTAFVPDVSVGSSPDAPLAGFAAICLLLGFSGQIPVVIVPDNVVVTLATFSPTVHIGSTVFSKPFPFYGWFVDKPIQADVLNPPWVTK